jgi:hypothetical protein
VFLCILFVYLEAHLCVPWVVSLCFLCILEALCILVLVYLEVLCAFFFLYNTLTYQKNKFIIFQSLAPNLESKSCDIYKLSIYEITKLEVNVSSVSIVVGLETTTNMSI